MKTVALFAACLSLENSIVLTLSVECLSSSQMHTSEYQTDTKVPDVEVKVKKDEAAEWAKLKGVRC